MLGCVCGQVYLAGYCHAFRYCPAGQHVEYREASRTPHEGNLAFISLDAHKGAGLSASLPLTLSCDTQQSQGEPGVCVLPSGPSRRSDLQSLGYCMLHWHTGALPWEELTRPDEVTKQKERWGPSAAATCLCRGGPAGALTYGY